MSLNHKSRSITEALGHRTQRLYVDVTGIRHDEIIHAKLVEMEFAVMVHKDRISSLAYLTIVASLFSFAN